MGQLEDLLRSPIPSQPPDTPEGYAIQRGRHATLRAFERKLTRLCREAETNCQKNLDLVHRLDDQFPEYQNQFQDNYVRALREVGKKPEDIPFMRYFAMASV